MNDKDKLIKIQKIIDEYVELVGSLPLGVKPTDELLKRIGVNKGYKSYIERSYQLGKLKARTRTRFSNKEIEKQFNRLTSMDKQIIDMKVIVNKANLAYLLEKNRGKLTSIAYDVIKRDFNVLNTVFKDEPIPKRWLAGELRRVFDDYKRDWDMTIRTELINTQMDGMAMAILDGSSSYSNDGGDTIVFKRPNPDACPHCKKHYLERDGITPKLFKLTDLMANGTNYGKKVSDWKPVLGTMHPHCQCQLGVMPKGCTFDKNGQITIIKKDRG